MWRNVIPATVARAAWMSSGPVLTLALFVHRYQARGARIDVVTDRWNVAIAVGAALGISSFVLFQAAGISAGLQRRSKRHDSPRAMLFSVVMLSAVTIAAYALLYIGLGMGGLVSGDAEQSRVIGNPADALYLSAVTFSTLGYGDVQPLPPARPVAALEAYAGLIFVALIAGAVVNRLASEPVERRFVVKHTGCLPSDSERVWCVIDTWSYASHGAFVQRDLRRIDARRFADVMNGE